MKKIIETVFIGYLCFFASINLASATVCSDNNGDQASCETAGCVYYETTTTCAACSDGTYRKKENNKYICTDCTKRPDGAEWTGNGGDSDNCPWKINCPNKPGFEHGIWDPDSATATGTGSTSTCTYNLNKITCDATGGTCNKGYHKDGNSCIENVRGCSNNTGYEFYQTASDSYSDCYIAACTTGTMTFVPSGNMCESVPYGTCVNNEKPCSQIEKLRTSCGTGINNEIAGTVPVTISGFSSQYTDYTDCSCIKKNQPLKNDQDTNIGLATITYDFTNSGELGSVVSTDVTNCYAGYCRQSETATTCIQVPAGQYSGSGELQCHDCTAGATSDAGSISRSDCHYTKDTVFHDTAGTFTLPDDDNNIKIEWNWGN